MMGTVVGGRYRLDERVGRGSLGDVWRCVDQQLGRTVAVKLLVAHERLAQWIHLGWTRVMEKVDHHGVVHIYDSGLDPAVGLYVAMEYVQGEVLPEVLARQGRLPPARTMDLVAQVADALHALHGLGVVHGGLRPGRILVRPDGTVVLSAFGLDHQLGQPNVAMALGNARYLAPEQAMGGIPRIGSDVFCLGVVAYECLSGRPPFEADHQLEVAMRVIREAPPPLPPDVPPGIRSIVERAMAKDPGDRWPTAAALATAARSAS